ncbi:MAG: hypothetical protein NC102_07745 [Clostridium sp.]|nr:hypothetical protein [Clostridium sp.]
MKYNISTLAMTLALALLTACSGGAGNDEPGTPSTTGPTQVSVTMKSRAGGAGEEQNELINSWWLAFVKSGKVEKIYRSGALGSAVHEDQCSVELMPGQYTIYGFANIEGESFGLVEGSAAPAGLESLTWASAPANGENMPMTGKTTAQIKQQASMRFEVEVVRLAAKMQYDIQNLTGEEITVGSASLAPAKNNGAVKLFPNYGSLGSAPDLLGGATFSEIVTPVNKKLANEQTESKTFYLLESTATGHETEHYVVKLEVTGANGKSRTLSAQTSALQWINRNDHIILPLKVIDYSMEFGVMFYPPIGGYPAVLVDHKDDEYYATFGSSGKFVINSKLIGSDGSALGAKEYLDPKKNQIKVDDPQGIFSAAPAIDATTYEIIGELATGSKSGTAKAEISISVKNSQGSTPVEYTFTRTLYIIRK